MFIFKLKSMSCWQWSAKCSCCYLTILLSSSCLHDGSHRHSLHHLVRLLRQIQPPEGRFPSLTATPRRLWRWDTPHLHGFQEVVAEPWVPGWQWEWRGHALCQQNLIPPTSPIPLYSHASLVAPPCWGLLRTMKRPPSLCHSHHPQPRPPFCPSLVA